EMSAAGGSLADWADVWAEENKEAMQTRGSRGCFIGEPLYIIKGGRLKTRLKTRECRHAMCFRSMRIPAAGASRQSSVPSASSSRSSHATGPPMNKPEGTSRGTDGHVSQLRRPEGLAQRSGCGTSDGCGL